MQALRNGDASRLYGPIAVLVVAVIGLLLAWQGWNSRVMNFDYINFMYAADRLLSDGIWPDRGDVSSYWAFAPPGASLLMVPGMFLFDDPRLYESIASAALYVGTLFGVFALARMCFGLTCAYLSVFLYALSRNGLFYAGSVYPIGHPFFYVWMVYFCLLWARRNRPGYLAAAVVTWALGMYVDMVIAPALFLIPAIWLLHRPKVKLAPLAVGGLLVAAVWYPYLRFEQTRDFADLKSLVSRTQKLRRADYTTSWCAPTSVVQSLREPHRLAEPRLAVAQIASQDEKAPQESALSKLKAYIRLRSASLREGVAFNFDQMTWTPLAALPLLLLSLASVVLVATDNAAARMSPDNWKSVGWWLKPAGWLLLFLAAAVNEVLIARFLSVSGTLADVTVTSIRALEVALAVCGLVLLVGSRQIASRISRLGVQLRETRDDAQQSNAAVTAIALVVPWLVLMMVAEAGEANRYFWLWPLQMMFLVASVTYLPQRLHWPRAAARLAQVALVVIMITHPWLRAPLQAWASNGWSGPRIADIQAADFIAERLRAEGRQEASIGYQTFIAGFMARLNVVDSRYKAGGELDLYLRQRYGIVNTNRCAEGVSSGDEFRIVQQPPPVRPPVEPGSWVPLGGEVKTHELVEYFPVASDPSFQKLRQFGDFEVFRRGRVGGIRAGTSLSGQ
jgi:Dolichyl-phosphate-mannose-protein mannosyltransferase